MNKKVVRFMNWAVREPTHSLLMFFLYLNTMAASWFGHGKDFGRGVAFGMTSMLLVPLFVSGMVGLYLGLRKIRPIEERLLREAVQYEIRIIDEYVKFRGDEMRAVETLVRRNLCYYDDVYRTGIRPTWFGRLSLWLDWYDHTTRFQ